MTLELNQRVVPGDVLYDAPLGTTVDVYERTYVKEADGWHNQEGHVLAPANLSGGTVTFIGTRTITETLPQFQQRLATVCIGRANQSSVDLGPVRRALRSLRVPDFPGLYPGMYVHWRDDELRQRLPEGTVLLCGDPAHWDTLGVWTMTRGPEWLPLLGTRFHVNMQALRVYSYPEGTRISDWPEPPEGDPVEQIAQFKVAAWEVGWRAKRDSSWCGDFEQAMGRLDIDANVQRRLASAGVVVPTDPSEVPVGTVVREPAEINALPEGAVLRYPDATMVGSQWNMMVRTDSPQTPHVGNWQTEHLCGPNRGRYGGSPVVVYNGVGNMAIQVSSRAEMDDMPSGTVMQRVPAPVHGTCWTKEGDVWVSSRSGNSRASARFTPEAYRYLFIPGDRGVDAGRNPYTTPDPLPETGTVLATAEQQAALPEGAILGWESDGNWAWFYRTDSATNDALTDALVGSSSGYAWNHTSTVVWPGEGPLSVEVKSPAEMDAMPVGTEITEGDSWWVKQDSGQWHYMNRAAAASSHAFYLSESFRYSYVPLPNGTGAGTSHLTDLPF